MKLIVTFSLMLFVAPLSVEAAEIFFGARNPSVGIESIFEVGVFLKTDGENINAVQGKITFPDSLLKLKEVRDGNSLVNLWIKKPEAGLPSEALAKEGEIIFSGLVPGGFIGEDGYLFSLFFETKQKGQARIIAADEQILLADGQGSKASVKQAPLVISIKDTQKVDELPPLNDLDSPEFFTPQTAQDPSVFDGKWFLVFAAQDKASGISHYEIQEGVRAWEEAASPYLLEDQNLRSSIAVKAVDKAGNERIERLEAQNPAKWYENWIIWGIISGIGIVFVMWRVLKIRSTKSEIGNNDQNPKPKKV